MTVKHKKCGTPEWLAWKNARSRCSNPNHQAYHNYGARGIHVCAEWDGPDGFARFYEHVGSRPSPHHELDRIDNERGYEPGNVRWVTRDINARNRRGSRKITAYGKTMTQTEWAAESGLSVGLISYRLRHGWRPEDAVAAPAGDGNARPRAGSRRYRKTNRMLTVNGVTRCVADWAEFSGTKATTIYKRASKGWTPEECIWGKDVDRDNPRAEVRVEVL